jgi:hypothetical protein
MFLADTPRGRRARRAFIVCMSAPGLSRQVFGFQQRATWVGRTARASAIIMDNPRPSGGGECLSKARRAKSGRE